MHRNHPHTYSILVPLETFPQTFRGGERAWPRHITLLDGIVHVGKKEPLVRAIADVATSLQPFSVSFGAPHDNYGDRPEQDVVFGAAELTSIHSRLIATLRRCDCSILNPQFTELGDGYVPRSSGESTIDPSTEVGVWSILAVAKYTKGNELFPRPSEKVLESAFRLGST